MFTDNGKKPAAAAEISGSEKYNTLSGRVNFYDTYGGTVVTVQVRGIPKEFENGFLGFHIHEGGSCTGNEKDPFADAGGHYNPEERPHPEHKGDLPPLLNGNGTAWMAVYTDRFYPDEVIGKTVIIHSKPDDFRTQPSGDSGEKIACGKIKEWQGR
ncbi:MAG: superoxide dismutase family protein [Dorea sp.]|nr:superoxide dismutase family protein [Dorea sp.]